MKAGLFKLDLRGFRVCKHGQELQMRKKLFDLFLHFAWNPDVVILKEALHEHAWAFREGLNENSLYVHISRLRLLVEDDASHPVYLRTVLGMGFFFMPEGSEL